MLASGAQRSIIRGRARHGTVSRDWLACDLSRTVTKMNSGPVRERARS